MEIDRTMSSRWKSALVILTGVVVVAVLVTALQWGRPILIPIAMAGLFTLLLNPVVQMLDRYRIHHVISVLLTVSVASVILLVMGWLLATQVSKMLAELPKNTETIKSKIRLLRQAGTGPLAQEFSNMVSEISNEITPRPQNATTESDSAASPPQETAADDQTGEAGQSAWVLLRTYLGSILEAGGAFAFTMVLVVFFLIEQHELRDRILVLAGGARLSVTSNALDEMANRITRYLGMVAIVNGGFGLFLSGILFLLGMPYAILWGVVAASFRFIPYIGPWVGAAFPIVMSLALSNGWWQPLAVFGGVIVLELLTNNLVEPVLFGRTTGVSPTVLLVSAGFWLYLWGPLGLVLSIPFAVCLIVIGKNIPELGFLTLLLSDEPALAPHASYYQRLVDGQFEAALSIVTDHIQKSQDDDVYDELIVPALNAARLDMRRDQLTDDEYRSVLELIRRTFPKIRELGPPIEATNAPTNSQSDEFSVSLLASSSASPADRIAVEILKSDRELSHLVPANAGLNTLEDHAVARIIAERPSVICITSIPPGGVARARALCKELRTAAPDTPIIVARWDATRDRRNEREQLLLAGATAVLSTHRETCAMIRQYLDQPLMSSPDLTPTSGVEAKGDHR